MPPYLETVIEHLRSVADARGMEAMLDAWVLMNQRAKRAVPITRAYITVRDARGHAHNELIELARNSNDAAFGDRLNSILLAKQQGLAELVAHAWLAERWTRSRRISLASAMQHLVKLPVEFLIVELLEIQPKRSAASSGPRWSLVDDINLLGRFMCGVHIEGLPMVQVFEAIGTGIIDSRGSLKSPVACDGRRATLLALAIEKNSPLKDLLDFSLGSSHRTSISTIIGSLGAIYASVTAQGARRALVDHVLRETNGHVDARGASTTEQRDDLPAWAKDAAVAMQERKWQRLERPRRRGRPSAAINKVVAGIAEELSELRAENERLRSEQTVEVFDVDADVVTREQKRSRTEPPSSALKAVADIGDELSAKNVEVKQERDAATQRADAATQRASAAEHRLECCVCQDAAHQVLLGPCRHLCCCATCAPALTECPICRTPVESRTTVFF